MTMKILLTSPFLVLILIIIGDSCAHNLPQEVDTLTKTEPILRESADRLLLKNAISSKKSSLTRDLEEAYSIIVYIQSISNAVFLLINNILTSIDPIVISFAGVLQQNLVIPILSLLNNLTNLESVQSMQEVYVVLTVLQSALSIANQTLGSLDTIVDEGPIVLGVIQSITNQIFSFFLSLFI